LQLEAPFCTTVLERKTLEKLDLVLVQSIASAILFNIQLAKGPVNTKSYHVIVMEGNTSSKSPDKFLRTELGPYDQSTYEAGIPYVAAVLSSYAPKFSVGDGKEYKVSKRRKRNVESVIYKNIPLKANTEYFVFQRAYVSQEVFFSTPWLGPLIIKVGESDTQQAKGSLATNTIISTSIAALLFIVIVFLLVVIYRSRRQFKHFSNGKGKTDFLPMENLMGQKSTASNKGYNNEDNAHAANSKFGERNADTIYQEINDENIAYEELHRKEKEASYQEIIKNPKSQHVAGRSVKNPLPSTPVIRYSTESAGLIGINRHKNRRWSLVADDRNRVVLQQQLYDNVNNSDYINAIYVEGNNHKHEYIATQHPLKDTISDFWKMIHQEDVQTVVMLNQMKESNVNLPVFWPPVGKRACYGEIFVRTNLESSSEESIEIKLTITNGNSDKEAHEVKIFRFEEWPDKNLPRDTTKLLNLIKKVDDMKQHDSQQKPVVVMCRDGGNRTGAFLSILINLNRFKATQTMDAFETAQKLRSIRPQFMENMDAFEFSNNVSRSFIDTCYDKL